MVGGGGRLGVEVGVKERVKVRVGVGDGVIETTDGIDGGKVGE